MTGPLCRVFEWQTGSPELGVVLGLSSITRVFPGPRVTKLFFCVIFCLDIEAHSDRLLDPQY